MTALQGGACGITSADRSGQRSAVKMIPVMPGLVPGIHVFLVSCRLKVKDVDGRDKPGHDDVGSDVGIGFRRSSSGPDQRQKEFTDVENLPLPVVRRRGRGSREALCVAAAGF